MRRGSASVELALTLPVILLLVFGVMDGSWFLFHQFTTVVAAERGARIAAGALPDQDPVALAEEASLGWLETFGLDQDSADLEVTYETRDYGTMLHVDLSHPFEPLIGLAPFPESLRAHSTTLFYGDLYDETP